MVERSVFEQLDGVNDVLAKLAANFDADLLTGKQAARVVCAAADVERFASALKTLAMRRVDESGVWRTDGARTPAGWLADKTGASFGEAIGTVTLGEQLEQLPQVADAARRGQLSPVKTKMVADAAAKDPASESHLVGVARQGSMTALRKECAAATQRAAGPDAMAKVHARRHFRDWNDPDGAYRFEGLSTPDKGACFKKTLDAFTDQVFHEARRAGLHEPYEAYRADALVRMAQAATAKTTPPANGEVDEVPEPPKYTDSHVQLVLVMDATAYARDDALPGETCEIAGFGPIDVATAKRMCGNAIVDIVVTRGVDVTTLAHAGRTVTKAQYAALLAEGYECNVEGCGNTRFLEIDHLGDGWAKDRRTGNGQLAWKCPHCHALKSHKRWRDGPQLPNGKRTLIPPNKPPPDT